MAPGIMPLDVLKLRGVLERSMIPVQITHPLMQRGIARTNIANVALEVLDVNGVEADQCDIQSDIGLGNILAKPVGSLLLFTQMLLSLVESFKKSNHVALVRFGCGCETGLVDAIVYEVVVPGVGFVNLRAEVLGVQHDRTVLFVNEVVKLPQVNFRSQLIR